MPSKKILALNGHPADSSLSFSLLDAYQQGAEKSGHTVRRHNLSDMKFDPDFGFSTFDQPKTLEEDLKRFVEDLQWCDHVVLTTPLWWGGIPSKLKGLFDRTLLPGIAFSTREKLKSGLPKPLLTGKTVNILMTSDTPSWAFSLMYNWAARKQLERQIFKFVGIKPVHFTNFAPATDAKTDKVSKWLGKSEQLGLAAA